MLLFYLRRYILTSQSAGIALFCFTLLSVAFMAWQSVRELSLVQEQSFVAQTYYSPKNIERKDLPAIIESSIWLDHKPILPPYATEAMDQWLKINLKSHVDYISTVYVVLENPTLDLIDFFKVTEHKQVEQRLFIGDKRQLRYQSDYSIPKFEFGIQPFETLDIYIRVRTTQGGAVPVLVYNQIQFNEHKETLLLVWGAFLGVILIMTLYYISLYRAMRDSLYLAYASFSVVTLAYISTIYGFGTHIVPRSVFLFFSNNLGPLTLMMLASIFLFTKAFVTETTHKKRFGSFTFIALMILIIATSFFIPDRLVVFIGTLLLPLLFSYLTYISFVSRSKGGYWIRFYYVSWIPIIIGFPLTLMAQLEIIPTNAVNRYALLIAVMAQLSLTAISFSRRMKMMELQRIHQATHDRYTRLPNRSALTQSLNEWVDSRDDFVIVLIEVGNYLRFLPYVGPEQAARLVRYVSDILSTSLSNELKGGLSKDAIISSQIYLLRDYVLAAVISGDDLESRLSKWYKICDTSFHISGIEISVNPVLSAAIYPVHSDNADGLIQDGMQALDLAKNKLAHWAIYNKESIDYGERQVRIASDLRTAISENKLKLYHQPQIYLDDYRVYGSEVLLRWDHPDLGFVPPDEFVKVAEDLGIITDLTQWVIECALEQQKALNDAGFNHHISINISGKDVIDPGFYTRVSQAIKRSRLSAQMITLELTESVTIDDTEVIKNLMTRFDAIGVRFSIDDFGTGYSSMEALSEFSFDELKIDRSFVMNMLESERNYIIASNTIDLANRLNLATVAEGVENEQLVSMLKSSHCLIGQGYYFSKPLPFDEYLNWLKKQS